MSTPATRPRPVFRRAHAHQVARRLRRQRRDVRQDAHHVFLGLAHRQAADGVAVEADVLQPGQRFVAQRFVHAALDDAEQRVGIAQAVELVARAPRPAQRHAHRAGRFLDRGRTAVDLVGRAFVEHHYDVRIQRALDAHRFLGRQEQACAIDRRGELDAFLGDLAHALQAEHLEAARVGEDGLVPLHEAVQAAMLFHDFRARAQPQVEGVAQHDLRADFLQLVRQHGLDAAVGAHGHEDGRLDHAVVQRDAARRAPPSVASSSKFSPVMVVVRGFDEHGVAVAEEAVALGHRVGVGAADRLDAGQRRHQHQQGRLGQVEVGDQGVDHAVLVARRDEQACVALGGGQRHARRV